MNLSRIIAFSLVLLTVAVSCKKEPEDTVTYELTLDAVKPSAGTTTFSEIKYSDGRTTQTITNSTSNFSTKLVITPGFTINYSVKGTVTGATSLSSPTITYKVEKVTNGTVRSVVCQETSSSGSGTSALYTFNAAYTKIFNGTACQYLPD